MAFGTRVVAFEPSAKFFSGLSERDSDASHNASRARKSPRTMHAASAPRAPFAPGARGRAARRRAPSRYLRRAATARAKISGEGRVSDSDAGEATCSARDGEGAAETRASTRQVRLFQASSAFVATATAATLALGASAPAPPLAHFFRAQAAESALLRPEAEAALAAERERDRRAAERVVDAFLALSREDQIKVVDRLVFAADADRRAAAAAAAAATETEPVSSVSETFSFSSRDAPSEKTPFSFSSSSRDESGFGFGDENDARATEDPFAAADARDGWPARDEKKDGDEKKDAKTKAAALLAEPSSAHSSPSFDDARTDDTDDDSPSTLARSFARAGETAAAGVRTAAATAALRLSEAAPEGLVAETFKKFRDGAFPFSRFPSDADFGVPLAFAGLIALAIAPEIRNMTGGDAGDGTGDGTGDAGDIPNAGVARETGSEPAEAAPSGRVLWSRRDEGLDGTNSTPSVSNRDASASGLSNPQRSGVLWTRAEDDDAAARRREARKKNAQSRRAGGRNRLEDVPTRQRSLRLKNDGRNDSGETASGPPTVSLSRGLGPVEDENMENVRFSPRK